MDDNTKKNSWDDLLQDLGAKPDESAFERHQAPAQDIEPTVEWSEAEELVEETKASPGDWNSLAETLGLEVEDSPEPVEEPVAAKVEPPVVEKAKEPVPEKAAKKVVEEREPFGGFAAPEESSFEDEEDDQEQDFQDQDEFDTEEVDEVDDELPPLQNQVDQALSETAWEEDSEEDEAASENKDNEGISGEAARSAFDALFSDGASGWGSAFLQKPKNDDSMRAVKSDPADEVIDGAVEGELTESLDAKAGADGEEEESDRPKRKRSRRRRRGGRGRKSSSERTEGETNDEQSSEDQDAPSENQGSENSESDDEGEKKARRPRRRRSGQRTRPVEASSESGFDEDLEGDAEQEDDPDRPSGEGRGRQLHRNLPTWSDAIGMIVDANLELRAKSPSKPQSSRGGRGGRGGRGRRRKSSDSSDNSKQ